MNWIKIHCLSLPPIMDQSKWPPTIHFGEKRPSILKVAHFELFSIREDIGQMNDLPDQHPERVEELKEKMLGLRQEMILEGGDG